MQVTGKFQLRDIESYLGLCAVYIKVKMKMPSQMAGVETLK